MTFTIPFLQLAIKRLRCKISFCFHKVIEHFCGFTHFCAAKVKFLLQTAMLFADFFGLINCLSAIIFTMSCLVIVCKLNCKIVIFSCSHAYLHESWHNRVGQKVNNSVFHIILILLALSLVTVKYKKTTCVNFLFQKYSV